MTIKSTKATFQDRHTNYFLHDNQRKVFELSLRCQHTGWNGHRVIGHAAKDYNLDRLIEDAKINYCRELNSGWFISIDIVDYNEHDHKFIGEML